MKIIRRSGQKYQHEEVGFIFFHTLPFFKYSIKFIINRKGQGEAFASPCCFNNPDVPSGLNFVHIKEVI